MKKFNESTPPTVAAKLLEHKGLRLFDFFYRDCFVAALLAMTLFTPFFVLPSFAADDEMTVSVPNYIEIIKEYSQNSRSLEITDTTNAHLNGELCRLFSYNTNTTFDMYMYYTVKVEGGGEVNAWNGIGAGYDGQNTGGVVVMTKNDNSATLSAVNDALGNNPSPDKNPSVIAFLGNIFNPALFVSVNNGIALFRSKGESSGIWVSVGKYGGNVISGTFSPHDSAGVYTVTAHITTIAP